MDRNAVGKGWWGREKSKCESCSVEKCSEVKPGGWEMS